MLPHVLRRAPDVPCVVVVKGDNRHASVEQAKAEFGELVLEVVYEELLLRPTTVMRRVTKHLGFDEAQWRDEYLNMTGVFEKLIAAGVDPLVASRPKSQFRFQVDGGSCNTKALAKTGMCHAFQKSSEARLAVLKHEMRRGEHATRQGADRALPQRSA